SPAAEFADDFPLGGPVNRLQGVCTWYQERGYNTPSLYGTWLMAPYLHNGSVPTIWHLLRPDQRPDVWRTRLVGGSDQDRGFDTSLANYDFENLGWKFDVLNCGENDGVPFIS